MKPQDSMKPEKTALPFNLSRLPFSPPFRVISEFQCGTDAHIVDSAGNIIVARSE